MMRTWILLLALAAGSASGQNLRLERIDIGDAGLYTLEGVANQVQPNGISTGIAKNERLVEATQSVPARVGVIFGFRYTPVGDIPGARVEIQKVISLPSPGLKPPGKAPVLRISQNLVRAAGESAFTYYSLDEPWELVPGTWTFELWQGDRKLASQSFTLRKP